MLFQRVRAASRNPMERRNLLKGLLAAQVMPAAAADDYNNRLKGLPPLTIKDVKVITTSGGRNYRWVFLKIITSEPGLYGIGSANDNYQTLAVATALEKHLKPWLIGKDPDRIEDLWQSANLPHLLARRSGQQQGAGGHG